MPASPPALTSDTLTIVLGPDEAIERLGQLLGILGLPTDEAP